MQQYLHLPGRQAGARKAFFGFSAWSFQKLFISCVMKLQLSLSAVFCPSSAISGLRKCEYEGLFSSTLRSSPNHLQSNSDQQPLRIISFNIVNEWWNEKWNYDYKHCNPLTTQSIYITCYCLALDNICQHHNSLLPESWCSDFVSVKCTKLLGLTIAMERAVITSLWKTSGSSSLPSWLQLFRHCTALLNKDWSWWEEADKDGIRAS